MFSMQEAFAQERMRDSLRSAQEERLAGHLAAARRWRRLERMARSAHERHERRVAPPE